MKMSCKKRAEKDKRHVLLIFSLNDKGHLDVQLSIFSKYCACLFFYQRVVKYEYPLNLSNYIKNIEEASSLHFTEKELDCIQEITAF